MTYKGGKKFKAVDVIVSNFESSEGVSSKAVFKTIKETALVNGTYGSLSYRINYLKLRIISMVKFFLQIISPKIVERIKENNRYKNIEYIPLEKFEL